MLSVYNKQCKLKHHALRRWKKTTKINHLRSGWIPLNYRLCERHGKKLKSFKMLKMMLGGIA